MKSNLLLLLIFFTTPLVGFSYNISGRVFDAKSKKAIEFATVWIEGTGIGTVTDIRGNFLIKNISEGNYCVIIRCLGYTEKKEKISVANNTSVIFYLSETSLAIDEVTVTAERKSSDAATTYTLNKTALDHLQSVTVTDALSLLPGEQTNKYKTLTSSEQVVTLRGESQEMGNPGFGTVVEMDGVRLSGNATAQSTGGTDLRNVGNNNVERIDIIIQVSQVKMIAYKKA